MAEPIVKKLTIHIDERGYLTELLRCDDVFFKQFGQAYVSAIHPGVVKGFHKHSKQTEHISCLYGQVKLVLIDAREKSIEPDIYEFHLSPLEPKMIVVEPEVWYGWKCIGPETSLLINFTTHPHTPDNADGVRMDPHNNHWDYDWKIKDR